jgi:DNA replication protein DnaC
VAYERVSAALIRLKLTRIPACLDGIAETAAADELTDLEFLDQLLAAEVAARAERDVAMKLKLAHFPFVRTLDQFDFAAQPAVNERQLRELATGRFVAHGEHCLFLGPPGLGKTHLAIAVGVAAIGQGGSVYFLTVADLVEFLHRDLKEDRLTERRRALRKPKLLILDEIG